jgi:serine protease Do
MRAWRNCSSTTACKTTALQWAWLLCGALLLARTSLAADPAAVAEVQATPALEDLDVTQTLSGAARTRLDRARASVVKIRGFFGDSQSEAFHGSGFAMGDEGLIVTNYHVISQAVLYPNQYRLEFLADDGRAGRLRVHGFDIEHDLAAVKADAFTAPPLRSRVQIPNKGDRAYSIGYPLSLGLTITEGVANGLTENSLEQRIYYSGSMNPGMSGGPALDAGGAVYGVNVSVWAGKQSISFVVPAKHIAPLLARAKTPMPLASAREQVANQLLAHQAAMFASITEPLPTQTTAGYALPAKIAPSVESMSCGARVGVFVERDLVLGDLRFQHQVLTSQRLHPLQFAERLHRSAGNRWGGSGEHVTTFSCSDAIVALNGFDAKVNTCVRQYRMFGALYDIAVTVTSLNQAQRAAVSALDMRGVDFALGMGFARRYLMAMRWTP